MIRALLNQTYLENQDSSAAFDSPIQDLSLPTSSVSYQLTWDSTVSGEFVWYASLFPDPYRWENAVSCGESISVSTADNTETNSAIVVIPHYWLQVQYLKFTFTPSQSGSSGVINAAIRVVPI